MNSQTDFEKLQSLKNYSLCQGSGLITYFVSAGSDLWLTVGRFQDELSSASRIKSKQNRQNVTWALKTGIQSLKTYRKVPENGFAMFLGKCQDDNNYYVWRSMFNWTTKAY